MPALVHPVFLEVVEKPDRDFGAEVDADIVLAVNLPRGPSGIEKRVSSRSREAASG